VKEVVKVTQPIPELPMTTRTVTETTTVVKEPTRYPTGEPSIITKEVKEFINKTTEIIREQKPTVVQIGNLTFETTRILKKITKEDEKPVDKEPKAPQGFVYKTEVRLSETTNKMEVVRRLKPIKDNHGPMNGEPKLTDDLEYETCEDIDSKPTYNVDGQRVLKFIRRIVKKNSSKPQDKEDQAPEGYVYETVLKVDKKTTKVTEKPVPLVPTDGVKIYNTTTTIVTTEESKTPMPIQPVITTTTTTTSKNTSTT